ncbi:type IA DNA topoisomerase [Lamprocystis purpurea]|jgi:DNA topoisomerase-3|uniref:type IA DNA topoisomerase n=1 Tax=Lamprocystis purpurea TaxID=61598 RepID=UPI000381AAF3|nr:type IA DNA topoisomerase [Lamprocystis purpurea]
MSTVVIAEKPSVARDIARVLGATRKGQGFLEGNGYCVTWALGHLVHLAEPDDYGPPWQGRWSAGQLPMIPEHWRLKLAPKTADQFKIVKGLINDPATARLVCATDAGREGEHIFRLIYEHARCRKPFDRLWVSSLTDEAIRAGLRSLRPGSAYDDLARAARARSQADWLMGMNLTRAYTVHNRVLCTIGRVQTPTLAMICARDAEIARFQKVFFYELVAHLAEGFRARYSKDGETRIDKKDEAERLHRELAPHRTGTVVELEQQVQHNRPPPLYDLTTLQRDANRRFGFTAAQVLELAQALYETHKLISYPRTESRHIGEDLVDQLPGILQGLDHPQAPAALARLKAGHRLGRAYVDQTKLTDHHAILPTGRRVPAGLDGPLRRVYDLVQTRFVCVFLPDQVVAETRVRLDIGGADFVARGARVMDPGWTVAAGACAPVPTAGAVAGSCPAKSGEEAAADEPAEDQTLPPLAVGQTVHVDRLEVCERETSPPRAYTDATLLAAMKNAGRTIEDRELAQAMKASGLGTPATRAEMIEKLIRTGYVERQRKQLRATEKGRVLIERVALPLKSPELTAAWEQQLREVEEGSRPVAAFYQGIVDLVRDLIPKVWAGPAFSPEQVATAQAAKAQGARPGAAARRGKSAAPRPAGLGSCPLCKQGEIQETTRAFGCSRYREGCTFTVWKTIAGLKLTKEQVRQLVAGARVGPLDGFQSKAGKAFSAALRLGEDGKVVFEFGPAAPSTPAAESPAQPQPHLSGSDAAVPAPIGLVCPKCGQGRIIQGHRGFGCDRYRAGCDFAVLREVCGKRLTDLQIAALIRDRRTRLIKGFSDDQGQRFDARLELDEGFKVQPRRTATQDSPPDPAT